MKRLFLWLFFVFTFVTTAQAQSCDEALVYFVAAAVEMTPVVAQTVCDGNGEVMELKPSMLDQFVSVDAWSMTTNTVAYEDFGTILTISEANPTPQVVLEGSSITQYYNPVWSPDGTQLLLVENLIGNEPAWLVVTDLDGNVRRIVQITNDPETELVRTPISWSPDGAWISYGLSKRENGRIGRTDILLLDTACIDDPAQTCETHSFEITDGSGERPSIETECCGTGSESWSSAAWSPDGEEIAFACGRNLCFLNADGTNFRRSVAEFYGIDLVWSPSGQYIAYSGLLERDIYIYDIEEDEYINLTQTPDIYEFMPRWIPMPEGEFFFE